MKPVSKIDQYVIRKVMLRRKKLGISQAGLSFELNVSAGYIGQVESESNNTRYSLERLNEIARILKCSLHDLLPAKPL